MTEHKQLELKLIMDTSRNWFAIPKVNGIKNEINYQKQKLIIESRKSISNSLQICKRLVKLYKELEKQ